jgi:hypothetical protein
MFDIISHVFSCSVSRRRGMVGRLTNNELERMWKASGWGVIEISRHLPGGSEENHENELY